MKPVSRNTSNRRAGTEEDGDSRYDRYDREPWNIGSFIKGIALTVLGHLLFVFYPSAVPFIGLIQLVYVLPLLIVFRKRRGYVYGVLVTSIVTLLLNSFAFGYAFYKLT